MTQPPDQTEFVYLIGSEDSTLVKIGRTTNVPVRLAAIQRMSPVKLTVLWQTEGGAELESALHRHFKDQRSHGEWFEFPDGDAQDQVMRAIAEMAAKMRRAQKVRKVWKAPRRQRVMKVYRGSRIALRSGEVQTPASQYKQVTAALRQKIESGTYPTGSLLPSEPELAKMFGVTRPVINKALSQLRTEGVVRPQRGRGTTVTYQPERRRRVRDLIDRPQRFREVMRSRAPEFDEADVLGIDDDQRIITITRTTIARQGRAVEVTELMPAHRFEFDVTYPAVEGAWPDTP